MNSPSRHEIPWGGWLLVGAGVLALAGNFGWLDGLPQSLWSTLLVLGGGALAALGLSRPGRWWALIPAGALVGAGLASAIGGLWAGAAMLGSLAAGFLAVATRGKDLWWALIPGGTLFTLALVTLNPGQASADWLFLGLAATFGVVALSAPSRRWALYPAGGALVLWALSTAWLAPLADVVWPLGLIALGAFILIRRGSRAAPAQRPRTGGE